MIVYMAEKDNVASYIQQSQIAEYIANGYVVSEEFVDEAPSVKEQVRTENIYE